MASDNSERNTIYEGINGKTFWILIKYNFTGMKHGDKIISIAYPIDWLRHLLNQYYTTCDGKCTQLDQRVGLFNNPDVNNLLQPFGYTLHTTGSDTSHQNGPV